MLITEALERLQTRLQAPFGSFWSEQEGLFALTEALRVWQALTGSLVADLDFQVDPGTVWFNAPRDFVSVQQIAISGVPLTQYSTAELDAEFGDWEAAAPGTPKRWAPEGAALLVLHPPPSAATTLTITGIQDISLLGKGEFEIADEELTRVLGYAHSPYLTFKSAPPELETEALSRMAKAAGEANASLRKSDFYKRYAGMDRVFATGQDSNTERGNETLGARGN